MSPQLPEPSGLLVYGFLTIQLTMAVGLLYCIVRTSGTKALPKAAALLVAWLGLTAGLASTGMKGKAGKFVSDYTLVREGE